MKNSTITAYAALNTKICIDTVSVNGNNSSVNISGWALDQAGTKEIWVLVDGVN